MTHEINDNYVNSVGRRFLEICAEQPDFPAFIHERGTISYAQLANLCVSYGARLAELGVKRGSIVALNTRDAPNAVVVLLALAFTGARLVTANKVLASTKAVRPDFFLKTPEVQGSRQVVFQTIDASWQPTRLAPVSEIIAGLPRQDHATDPLIYLHTSGSTGTPKYFVLSDQMVLRRSLAMSREFERKQTRVAILQNAGSRPFYARAMAALLNGCTIVDSTNTDFWYRAGVTLVTGALNQIHGHIGDRILSPRFANLEVSGTELRASQIAELLKSFVQVENAYGAGETSKSYGDIYALDEALEIKCERGHCEGEIQVVDDADQPVSAGTVGRVRVRNGFSIQSYLGNNAPDSSFRDGWFYSGDTAVWTKDDRLELLGRIDNVINLAGIKVNALLVDMVIESVDGISRAATFKNPKPGAADELIAFIVLGPAVQKEYCIEQARHMCLQKLGAQATPANFWPVNTLPLTEKHEVDRPACAKLLLARAMELGAI
ncbi:Acyl-CoA synthetase (AMP-forming)/AMP-acid ligase II [Yoonia tamlensis]|uniref:Acyl-CoA synthetase (AMP-forming)/AMP-acid ligase II n=1 Tax=Yoonia tamlensis TaxID=390270 RepID=A0A1I6GL19_9RHOB|nr:class I adenylate-forming enzyme family protein [Yoonia tamlensis]SFR42868.1 Acyl-CoA synthetase (AMP-forming)/AMP-acid ligase II [Yoonia tamlensis]